MDKVSESLLDVIEEQYGFRPKPTERLRGGDEADIFRATGPEDELVVRICPAWRSIEQLDWSYRRSIEAARQNPEIVTPLSQRDGKVVIEFDQTAIAIFPYREGESLDLDVDILRDQAADLLARLHNYFIRSPGYPPRPSSCKNTAHNVLDTKEMIDPVLDRYLDDHQPEWNKSHAVVHGDFYRRNILCRENQIYALIDWDDCREDTLFADFAWSVWEFCKDRITHDRLNTERAYRFVDKYRNADGPLPTDNLEFVVPLIRQHLRV